MSAGRWKHDLIDARDGAEACIGPRDREAVQEIRKRIEDGFGWGNESGLLRRTLVRGRDRVEMAFTFTMAARNLVRLPQLLAEPVAT